MIKRVFKYLKNTSRYGILFGKNSTVLEVFSDADYGGGVETRRSTSGVLFK